MKNAQQSQAQFTIDANGHELAHVALANSQFRATLYAEDYRRLISAGFSRFWNYTQDGRGNYYPVVHAYTSDGDMRLVTIARLVANAASGERIRYADGNSLNLRSENLVSCLGAVWYRAKDWYPSVDALRAAGIEPRKRTRVRSNAAARALKKSTANSRGVSQSAEPSALTPVPPPTYARRGAGASL